MSDFQWGRAFKHAVITAILFFIIVVAVGGVFILVDYKHMGRLVKVIGLVRGEYLEQVPWDTVVDGAIKGIAGNLDEYSGFQDEQENQNLQTMIEGQFGGIGIYVGDDIDKLMVSRPIKGSPAEEAGLETGDEIVLIDGDPVANMTQAEAIARLKGKVGTQVTIEVYRASSHERFERELTRAVISVPSVEWGPYPGEPDIAVVEITTFSRQTPGDFDKALSEIDPQQYKGILVDLRNNLGGEFNAAIYIASRLTPRGPVVHTVNRNKRLTSYPATGEFIDVPFVLLVNQYSASSSEIVTGAVKDNASAPIVGVTTFGKGLVQKLFELDANTGLKLTTEKYLTPDQNDIHKIGVVPDYEVPLEQGEKLTLLPGEEDTPDRQMQKACEVLKDKLGSIHS
ncbi:MAG: S41 family peptidase [Peptococcaceae bacterium]|nr:S41 family peptidase [Peptococcaceae bacterium]